MSRALSVILTGALASAVITAGVSAAGAAPLDEQVTALTAKVETTTNKLADAEKARDQAVALRDETTKLYETRQAVLDVRPAFVEAVASAQAAFTSANGKVDVSALRQGVLDAQATVLAEREDPAVVTTATATVVKAAADAAAQVKAYDDRIAAEKAAAAKRAAQKQPKTNSSARNTGGGGGGYNWFQDLRNRLNNVGGGWVQLFEFDGQCGSVRAAACSWSTGKIGVTREIAGWRESRKNWVMVHEYAHQIYFRNINAISNSNGYRSLFGSNPELLANCMASAWGYTDHGHNGQCYGDRLSWARSIWNGVVPW